MRIIELFAGIGACSKALENIGIDVEIVDAVEIDKYAMASFNAIHNTNFEPQDITKWDKDFKDIDLIMHGSPCQDFSVAGKQAGGDVGSGTRSSLMYETIRIVGKLRPKYVVWENVKNLLSKKHKHNFDAYIETMKNLGYVSYYQVLNAKDYGIPQNRERVFTISIRKDIDMIRGYDFEFPEKEELNQNLQQLLEKNVDEKYFVSEKGKKYILKRAGNYVQLIDENTMIAHCPITAVGNANWTGNFVKFEFPLKEELKIRLKDILEQEVDEKYYLKDYQIENIKKSSYIQNQRRIQEKDWCDTLCARDWKDPKCVEVVRQYGIFDTEESKHQAGSVYNKEGLAPTLDTMQGGWRQPCVEVSDPQIIKYDAKIKVKVRKYPVDTEKLKMVLRDAKLEKDVTNEWIAHVLDVPETTVEHWFRKDNAFSIPTPNIWLKLKEYLEIKTDEFDESITTFEEKDNVYEKNGRIYDTNGIAPTLTLSEEKIVDPKCVEENKELKFVGSIKDKDIVGDGKTLSRNASMGDRVYDSTGVSATISAQGGGVGGHSGLYTVENEKIIIVGNYMPSGHDASRIVDSKGIAPTVKENHGTVTAITEEKNMTGIDLTWNEIGKTTDIGRTLTTSCRTLCKNQFTTGATDGLRIRKLTPKECWRLMGFDDEDFEKAAKVNSNTQLYKQARKFNRGKSIRKNLYKLIERGLNV